jgi:hypothetical protein
MKNKNDCREYMDINPFFLTFAVRLVCRFPGRTDLISSVKHIQISGLLAEWLGGGLQNRIRRFESARDLGDN